MEKLFVFPMNWVMGVLLAIFLVALAILAVMAWRNRIMLKLGLRNIPRRRSQTVLIIIGVMLSSVITAAAFGTGDTISHSIRTEAVELLGPIDEVIFSARFTDQDRLGTQAYIPYERFELLRQDLSDLQTIDGLQPLLGETVPALNTRTSLSEGRMRVAGVDGNNLEGFGGLVLMSGGEALLDTLAPGEAYINDKAAEELDARQGDELRLVVSDEPVFFSIRGVVKRGGLAGEGSTMILPLEQAQALFGREGQINSIVVSNRGGDISGVEHSENVTRRLRVLFADPLVAKQLQELLGQEQSLKALETWKETVSSGLQEDLEQLGEELQRGEVTTELISLLSDEDVSDAVLDALGDADLNEIEGTADTLFANLAEFRVLDFKRFLLEIADDAGSVVTTLFITMAMFTILVGILLIFLIFVMLAAARRPEMGMARAIGAKRGHIVMMFVFEGTAYALVATLVGVLLGWGVSTFMVAVLNSIISSFDLDFRLSPLFKPRSAIVAYCLGMVITFSTVTFSAFRVSRMNIAEAVRGLPETLVLSKGQRLNLRVLGIVRALGRPVIFLYRGINAVTHLNLTRATANTGLAAAWVLGFPIWIIDICAAVIRFLWPFFLQGWLTLLLGLLIVHLGVSEGRDSIFMAGGSLMVIGLGFMGRQTLQLTPLRADVQDRISFTSMGVLMLVFWVLPPSTFEGLTGQLTGDIEMMFVSGIFMVAAAVWTVMYNADLMLKGLARVTGRFGSLRPVMVTAVAYPMSAKFRTGLTLLMFGLVTFTMVVMSVIIESFGDSITSDVETVTGRWDIRGDLNFNTPIEDIHGRVEDEPSLQTQDYDAIGGYTEVPIEARQIGAEKQRWSSYSIRAVDDDFLDATEYKLKLIAQGYGPTPDDVWKALKTDPTLTVVEGSVLPVREGESTDFGLELEGVYYEDETMQPLDIQVREPLTDSIVSLKVIGVLDNIHDPFEIQHGMITSKSALDEVIPFPIPIVTYLFRTAEGVDVDQVSKDLEASFSEFGMETEVLEDEINAAVSGFRAFYYLLIAFMGLGLVVGIAGLGVITTRAVVERRQQIGVLRAIGYRRRMVQVGFLLESSFVALLGIAIGVILGATLSYNAIKDIRAEEAIDNLRYHVPWIQVLIIVVFAYLFSLVTTFLPARQASRTYPAEALRYE